MNTIWHTYWAIEHRRGGAAMHAARQQHGEIGLCHDQPHPPPVALASMLLLLPPCCSAGAASRSPTSASLAPHGQLALLANAFVCGVLSNPHDRYGARLVWIAPLVVLLALARLMEARAPRLAAGQR